MCLAYGRLGMKEQGWSMKKRQRSVVRADQLEQVDCWSYRLRKTTHI